MRYRFKNGKLADLYFNFNNENELVIELQRNITNISRWYEKREFYKQNNINDIWFISGKIENFNDIVREYDFLFEHRLVLNNINNRLLILDVDKELVLIAAKITIIDDETNEVVMDYLFKKVYKLSEIKISRNGKIECSFDIEFENEKNKVIDKYKLEKCEKEEERIKVEQERKIRENEEEELRNKYIRQLEERRMNEKSINKGNSNYNKTNYSYKKDESYYKDKVNKAIKGYRYGIENLVNILVKCGSDQYYLIKKLFNEEIEEGNQRARVVYAEVMRQAGLD